MLGVRNAVRVLVSYVSGAAVLSAVIMREKIIVFFQEELEPVRHSFRARPHVPAERAVFVHRLGVCSPDNVLAYLILTARPSIRPLVIAGSVTIRNHRVLVTEVLPVFFKASTSLKSFLRQVRHVELILIRVHTTGRYTAELRASTSTPHKHVEVFVL